MRWGYCFSLSLSRSLRRACLVPYFQNVQDHLDIGTVVDGLPKLEELTVCYKVRGVVTHRLKLSAAAYMSSHFFYTSSGQRLRHEVPLEHVWHDVRRCANHGGMY